MSNPSSDTISVRIPRDLYEQARSDAASEHRTIPGQIEYWAKVGRAALDNPDLPVRVVLCSAPCVHAAGCPTR